jgi:hypothetical protein
MTPEEFDAYFDQFGEEAWRIELLQRYTSPGEEDRIRAWREGQPRPDRSVRTSPWLRRVAVTTATGKRWGRVHVVHHPLSEYLRYQLLGYVESAAAGEEIRIADLSADPSLATLGGDFWLFDAASATAFALLMHYDEAGRWMGAEHTTDPEVLDRCRRDQSIALAHSVPLNVYLARLGTDAVRRVA